MFFMQKSVKSTNIYKFGIANFPTLFVNYFFKLFIKKNATCVIYFLGKTAS